MVIDGKYIDDKVFVRNAFFRMCAIYGVVELCAYELDKTMNEVMSRTEPAFCEKTKRVIQALYHKFKFKYSIVTAGMFKAFPTNEDLMRDMALYMSESVREELKGIVEEDKGRFQGVEEPQLYTGIDILGIVLNFYQGYWRVLKKDCRKLPFSTARIFQLFDFSGAVADFIALNRIFFKEPTYAKKEDRQELSEMDENEPIVKLFKALLSEEKINNAINRALKEN